MTEQQKKKIFLTRKEQLDLAKLLEQHVIVITEGVHEYAHGWSDARVLETLGLPHINALHVKRYRASLFGEYREAPAPGDLDAVHEKIAMLDTKLLAAVDAIRALEARVKDLELQPVAANVRQLPLSGGKGLT